MSDDLKAFKALEAGANEGILRIYSWQPRCISLGYSQDIEEEIDLDKAKKLVWDVVQRPTGGGLVFHNEAEVTYSLIIAKDKLPAGLVPSFAKISVAVILALKAIGINAAMRDSISDIRGPKSKVIGPRSLCFSYPEGYEIVANGKKLVGAAQKRGERALLQQGSIYVKPIEKAAYQVLKRPFEEPDAVSVQEILGRVPSFEEMSEALIQGFREKLDVK
jgi:lipoate-protein ligase A